MFNADEVLKERKTNKYGFRFKPGILGMLKEISENRKKPMAELLELLIFEEYKKGVDKSGLRNNKKTRKT